MHTQHLVIILAFACVLFEVNCQRNYRREEKCVNYYRTGINFDLNQLPGNQWYAVYFWPPIQRNRESCAVLNFRSMSDQEIDDAIDGCDDIIGENETVVHSNYRNSTGKLVNVIYYGNEEVKYLMRSCDKVYKYIFNKINDNYVIGINCSSGGRGVLLAKYLPSYNEVQSVVNGIEFMTGREGKPDCPLR